MPTAREAAEWMAAQFAANGRLTQARAVRHIMTNLGAELWYRNRNGNPAIAIPVLEEFRILAPDAVWHRGGFYWRKRKATEPIGAQ